MKPIIVKKENGEVTIVADEESTRSIITEIKNPCFECTNGYVTKCPKMADEVKKNISKYDFITDGYQIYNEDGEVDIFAISKCSNFVRQEKNKPTTKEEIARLRYLKESIKILYFDAVDIDEADKTHHDLQKRGSLVSYNAYNTSNSHKCNKR